MPGTTEVWLFDTAGADLGFMPAADAQALAAARGLDLVGPEGASSPPRFRLADAVSVRAAQARAARIGRGDAAPKEIRLRVGIGAADLETRRRSAAAMLDGGRTVKLRVELDPRKRSDPAPARAILDSLVRALSSEGTPEGKPFNEKGAVAVILAPR
jgi:translation initiation factor IF-3